MGVHRTSTIMAMSPKRLRATVTFSTALAAFAAASGEEVPDIRSVEPDLVVPAMVGGVPAPGRRVKQTTAGWENTQVHHALYLPVDWQPEMRYPVIVEYAGNGPFTSPYGDVSTGKVEGSCMGYGISGGQGVIWVCMPCLDNAGARNVTSWWGNHPEYKVQPTIDYCMATLRMICERYGGDPTKVFLAGFSRGSIACNYIGLHNDAWTLRDIPSRRALRKWFAATLVAGTAGANDQPPPAGAFRRGFR